MNEDAGKPEGEQPQKNMPTLIPGAKLVLDYLMTGRHLTNLIATTNLGVGSLTSRISEIKKYLDEIHHTHTVKGEWKKDIHGKRYKNYSLVKRK